MVISVNCKKIIHHANLRRAKSFYSLFIFLFLLGGTVTLQSQEAYKSGHVIVIHHDDVEQENYIIFGLSKRKKLSTFGGLRDSGENHPKDTAAREAEEEGLGVLGSKSTVRDMLVGLKEITKNNGHYCYILPCKDYGSDLSNRFTSLRFNPKIKLPYCKREMLDLVAVKVDTVRNKVWMHEKLEFKDNNGKLRSLRSKNIIKAAVKNGCFDDL